MRSLLVTGLIVAIGVVTYTGCDAQSDASGTPTLATDDVPGGLLLPEGSEVWEETVDGATSVRFRLPDTHALVGLSDGPDGTDVAYRETGGEVNCTCTEGSGGCSPFRAERGGQTAVGCAMDETRCSSCDLTTFRITSDDAQSRELRNPVIIDTSRPIKIVETHEEARGLTCGASTLMNDPEVLAAIAEYIRPLQGDDPSYVWGADPSDPDDDVISAPLDVYGSLVWVPYRLQLVDADELGDRYPDSELVWDRFFAPEARVAEAAPGDGGGSCTCESGEGGCTYESKSIPVIGKAEWCQAGVCNSCTLNS